MTALFLHSKNLCYLLSVLRDQQRLAGSFSQSAITTGDNGSVFVRQRLDWLPWITPFCMSQSGASGRDDLGDISFHGLMLLTVLKPLVEKKTTTTIFDSKMKQALMKYLPG